MKQPITLPTSTNYIAPKKGAIPDKVQIQILPRARLPAAPMSANVQQPTKMVEIIPVNNVVQKPQAPKQQQVKPTIVQVNEEDDEDDSIMSDSPRTRSLRMIAQTVKTYY